MYAYLTGQYNSGYFVNANMFDCVIECTTLYIDYNIIYYRSHIIIKYRILRCA